MISDRVIYKIIFLVLFIFLINGFSQNAQPFSHFPYGTYIYKSHGLSEAVYGLDSSISAFRLWKNELNANNQVLKLGRGYGLSNDTIGLYSRLDSLLDDRYNLQLQPPIIISSCFEGPPDLPLLSDIADGQYIKFLHGSSDNIIVTNNIPGYRVSYLNDGGISFTNCNSSTTTNNKQIVYTRIIDNVSVENSYNNNVSIRPRDCNTVNNEATFYISIECSINYTSGTGTSSKSLSNTNFLNVSLINQNPDYGDSDVNHQPLGQYISIINGVQTLSFKLIANRDITISSWLFWPKLTISCLTDPGFSFTIKNIKIYDAMGKSVIEDNYLGKTSYINNIILNGLTQLPKPILHLCDEPTIGNFSVMRKIQDYIDTKLAANEHYYYVTAAEESYNSSSNERLLNNLSKQKLIFAPDIYPIREINNYGVYSDRDSTLYSLYNTNLIDLGYTYSFRSQAKKFRDLVSASGTPAPYLYCVPQAHGWENAACRPSFSEIVTEGYLALLYDYKGISYWTILPDADVTHRNIYIPYVPPMDRMIFINNRNNLVQPTASAIKKVGEFLNRAMTNEPGIKIGDKLLQNHIDPNCVIIGDTSNYVDNLMIGSTSKVLLNSVDIIDMQNGGRTLSHTPNDPRLVGVGYLNTVSQPEKSFFLITNLDKDNSRDTKLRLKFNTSRRMFLRVTANDEINVCNRLYPANGLVLLTLPAKGALLIEVETTNTPDALNNDNFPNGKRFGISRVEGNSTHVILDKYFYQYGSTNNEFAQSLYIDGTNNQVFTLNTNNDNYSDIGSMKYSFSKDTAVVTFDFYRQMAGASFTHDSTCILRINTGSNVTISPIVYPIANGIDKYGCVINNGSNYRIKIPGLNQDITLSGNCYSPTGLVKYGRWNKNLSVPTLIVFRKDVNTFYIDTIGTRTSFKEIGFSNGENAIPLIGDWANRTGSPSIDEYGVLSDNYFYSHGFYLNFSNTDGWSYFEFPYGNPGDQPLVWTPYPDNAGQDTSIAVDKSCLNKINNLSVSSYPNPFNPSITLRAVLPSEAYTEITIFNILGQKVSTIVSEVLKPGEHNFVWNASTYSSGIYIVRYNIGGKHFSKKIVLNK